MACLSVLLPPLSACHPLDGWPVGCAPTLPPPPLRLSPQLTSIYKDVFLDVGVGLAEHRCLDDDAPVCAISPHHPAVSAVVRFLFETPHTNTRGASVQTQLACQCMNADCTNIATVAIRRPPAAEAASPDANGSCTYQAVALGGGEQPPTLHSCVSALMHIGTVNGRPEGPYPLEDFEYNVSRFGDSAWSAQGYRNVRVARWS